MKPAVAFVTCSHYPQLTPDDRIAAAAVERRDIHVIPVVWDDETVDWRNFDLIVLRSMWDYHLKVASFYAWLDRLEPLADRVVNSLSLARWNADKHYLYELQERGASVVPTLWAQPSSTPDLASTLAERGWGEVVLKPAVSSTAHRTRRFVAAEMVEAQEWLAELLEDGAALVQEYQPEIASDGEWSLSFIDGEFSHAVVKRAVPGDFRVQEEWGGTTEPVPAPRALIDEALRILGLVEPGWLYARVDGVRTPHGFRLMELELLEPGLFFINDPVAAERFADAIAALLSKRIPC